MRSNFVLVCLVALSFAMPTPDFPPHIVPSLDACQAVNGDTCVPEGVQFVAEEERMSFALPTEQFCKATVSLDWFVTINLTSTIRVSENVLISRGLIV